uniref:Glucose-methanol-choline oxidoreductase N-terminal domain-containing protein n=1 Tax=Ciona savignyi TaxID=51511 RepID=H2Y9U3_CIOSA
FAVGAGTSGNVVANRLTESPHTKVLVLEAGDNDAPNIFISTPLLAPLVQGTTTDWMYRTEPQENACNLLTDNVSFWPRGKVIGGSSCMHFMWYVRGHKDDFDSWEKSGATGWGYKDVLGYFKKSENAMNKNMTSKFHGKDGPLKTSYPYHNQLADIFVEAGKELGYNHTDYNAENMIGFNLPQQTLYNGQRESSSTSFLRPVIKKRRDRLHIVGRAHVRQVVFEENKKGNKRATGVIFVKDGVEIKVRARKEVIFSGGSVGTPQLLMLSGIGPRKHLEEMGIDVIADMPGVGQNLQDHLQIPATFIATNLTKDATVDERTVNAYIQVYFTSLIYIYIPDIQLVLLSHKWTTSTTEKFQKMLNFKQEVSWSMNIDGYLLLYVDRLNKWGTEHNTATLSDFLVYSCLLRPASVGYLKLRSNNYQDHPIIQPNYLSNKRDVETLIEVIEQLEKTKHFKEIGAKMEIGTVNCGNTTSPRSDEFYECMSRALTMTIYHPVGTAKMGSENDIKAVVDSRLKVYKVDGLRVADASVMPTIPSANTQAACYMIGEKAADMIKQDWKL